MDSGVVQVHRFSLPQLPLDRTIPQHVLAHRRGAISFSSGSSLFEGLPRLERRGGISYDRNDIDAQYVRMLGDIGIRKNLDKLRKANRLRSMARLPQLPSPVLINDNDVSVKSNETTIDGSERLRHRNCTVRHLSITIDVSGKSLDVHKPKRLSTVVLDMDYHNIPMLLLRNVDEWEFDAVSLEEITQGHSLFNLALYLFRKHNLITTLKLDMVKLRGLFKIIEQSYHRKNPYHNSVHVADVTQALHCYLIETKIAESLTDIEIFYSLMAALLHDIDHPGVNQSFLIATSHFFPKLVGHVSVLENHHCRAGIALLRGTGIIEHLPRGQQKTIEKQIVALILATDMAKQQDYLSKFKELIDKDRFDINQPDHKTLMLQIALKCADICNPCRSWLLCNKWSYRVTSEFFNQGEKEKELGLAVSPLCDGKKNTTAGIQVGFYKGIAKPLFSCWSDFLQTRLCDLMLDNMNENLSRWEKMVRDNR